jgi:3-polyprenyl-4-hydroxybenzoate decarboxylase
LEFPEQAVRSTVCASSKCCKQAGVETHLVMSDSAKRTIVYETDYTIDQVKKPRQPRA